MEQRQHTFSTPQSVPWGYCFFCFLCHAAVKLSSEYQQYLPSPVWWICAYSWSALSLMPERRSLTTFTPQMPKEHLELTPAAVCSDLLYRQTDWCSPEMQRRTVGFWWCWGGHSLQWWPFYPISHPRCWLWLSSSQAQYSYMEAKSSSAVWRSTHLVSQNSFTFSEAIIDLSSLFLS